MKFITNQKEFAEAIAAASRFVSARPSHPVLGNLKIKANFAGTIEVSGFDLSVSFKTEFTAVVLAEGEITLPCKLLTEIISRLPDGDLTLELNPEDDMVTVTSPSGKYQIRGISASEYPTLPTSTADPIALSPVTLKTALGKVLYAASTDETKQILTGVNIQQTDTEVTFAATDGHRLAIATIAGEHSATINVTIPSRALAEVDRLIKKLPDETAIALRLDNGTAVFTLGTSTELTCRVLDGAYPAYRQLIPVQFSRKAIAQTNKMLAAINRVGCLADVKNNLLHLDLSGEFAQISTNAQDIGQAFESVAVDYTGAPITIGFNLKYLSEALKSLGSDEFQLNVNESNQPVTLQAIGGNDTHLIMPVQIVR